MNALFAHDAPPDVIRCLSLHQPYALAMPLGHKGNETRHWKTSYRGPLLIHAAKQSIFRYDPVPEIVEWLLAEGWLQDRPGRDEYDDSRIPYGAIVGMVTLIDCVETHVIKPLLSAKEIAHGNYDQFTNIGGELKQRYAFVTENPIAFRTPIPTRGQQGFWDVQYSVVAHELMAGAI